MLELETKIPKECQSKQRELCLQSRLVFEYINMAQIPKVLRIKHSVEISFVSYVTSVLSFALSLFKYDIYCNSKYVY